jgi:hypothetical protein
MGASGMQHLLKAMGVDPAEIMQGLEGFKTLANNVAARQERIEAKLDKILEILEPRSKDGTEDLLDQLRLDAGMVLSVDPEFNEGGNTA